MIVQSQIVSGGSPRQNKYDPKQTLSEGTWSAPSAATIGVANATFLIDNTKRIALLLVNTSSWSISISGPGQSAVLNSGITIPPFGSFFMQKGDLFFTTGALSAIAGGASSNLSIQEITS